jgi:hypothetical protein
MKAVDVNPPRKTSRTGRGLIESTLLKVAIGSGYQVTRVSPAKMAKAKGKSRLSDRRRIQAGQSTPGQIQSQNDMVPGKIEVLDWSPVFA